MKKSKANPSINKFFQNFSASSTKIREITLPNDANEDSLKIK